MSLFHSLRESQRNWRKYINSRRGLFVFVLEGTCASLTWSFFVSVNIATKYKLSLGGFLLKCHENMTLPTWIFHDASVTKNLQRSYLFYLYQVLYYYFLYSNLMKRLVFCVPGFIRLLFKSFFLFIVVLYLQHLFFRLLSENFCAGSPGLVDFGKGENLLKKSLETKW